MFKVYYPFVFFSDITNINNKICLYIRFKSFPNRPSQVYYNCLKNWGTKRADGPKYFTCAIYRKNVILPKWKKKKNNVY